MVDRRSRTWQEGMSGHRRGSYLARFVEVPIRDGRSLIVEVAEEPSDEVVRAGVARELTANLAESFEAALERVRSASAVIIERMRSIEQLPDEVGVEFAIKLGAEAGVVIAKSAVEANLTVRVKWSRDDGS
jgi:hypothetical protein